MELLKIIAESDKQKITKQKTFRLREDIADMLDTLSESAGTSQNEIVNSLLDDSRKTYNFIQLLKESLGKIAIELNKKLIVYTSKYLDDKSLLDYLTITYEPDKERFKCIYQIFMSEGFTFDVFENSALIFETITHFESYEDFLWTTDLSLSAHFLVLKLTDELKFTRTGLEKK